MYNTACEDGISKEPGCSDENKIFRHKGRPRIVWNYWMERAGLSEMVGFSFFFPHVLKEEGSRRRTKDRNSFRAASTSPRSNRHHLSSTFDWRGSLFVLARLVYLVSGAQFFMKLLFFFSDDRQAKHGFAWYHGSVRLKYSALICRVKLYNHLRFSHLLRATR